MKPGRLLVSLAGVVSACASPGSPGTGPIDASCLSELVRSSASLDARIDSTQAVSNLEDAWSPSIRRRVLLILTYDENGEPNPPSLLSAASDEVLRESLWRAVEGAIRPGPSRTDREVLMFLGDGSGPQLRRVDDFASCQPQIQNGPELQRRLGNLSRGLGLTRPIATIFRVQVRIDGSSGPAQIERSSGDSLIDDQARLIVEAARWSPAMIEGVPIPTTAQFPVRFIPVSTPGP